MSTHSTPKMWRRPCEASTMPDHGDDDGDPRPEPQPLVEEDDREEQGHHCIAGDDRAEDGDRPIASAR